MYLTGYFLIEVESFDTAIRLGRTHSERANRIRRSAAGHGDRLVAVRLLVPGSMHDSYGWHERSGTFLDRCDALLTRWRRPRVAPSRISGGKAVRAGAYLRP